MRLSKLLILAVLLPSLFIFADSKPKEKTTTNESKSEDPADHSHHHDDEIENDNLPAHLHGVGSLSISLNREESALEMEYIIPAHDILGFEHSPETNEQVNLYNDAKSNLKNPLNVFQLVVHSSDKKADCDMDLGTILTPYEKHSSSDDEENSSNKNKDHAHHHEGHDEAETTVHADYKLKFSFHCKDISQLKGVKTLLFEKYPALNKFQVVLIDKEGVFPNEITKEKPSVYFNE